MNPPSLTTESNLFDAGLYGTRPVGFGSRPAVLVVDFQRAVTCSEYPLGRSPMVGEAVERTAALLDVTEALGIPAVACVQAYAPGLADKPLWKVPAPDEWIEGSAMVELDERIARPGLTVLVKKAPSMFFGTALASILTKLGVDTTIVTGATTSGCVRATVVDSFSHGFHTIVISDCVADQGVDEHLASLRDVDRRYADVLSQRLLLQRLASAPAPARA